jgi:hydrogenase nickel incorporation protein HypA/HybF
MHELSITQTLLDLVLEQAKENEAQRVEQIHLVIGEMTGVVDDCVRFYFELLSKGTVAEGAGLSMRRIPATARCRECGERFSFKEFEWICPRCGAARLEIIEGKELYLESLEVI